MRAAGTDASSAEIPRDAEQAFSLVAAQTLRPNLIYPGDLR